METTQAAPETINRNLYAGAEWIRRSLKKEVSEKGALCADLLGWVFRGIYHLDSGALSRADWSKDHVSLVLYGSMATYDFNTLTRLVIAAHDLCVRVEIEAAAHCYLRLILHPRESRQGENCWDRHPTIETAIGWARTER